MRTNRNILAAGVMGAVLLASTPAYAISTNSFVAKASMANEFEIQTSQIALQKSESDTVKSFAQKMVDDHGATGNKLKQVLQTSGSDAKPAEQLDAKHQQVLDKLQNADGEEFDRQYIAIQTDAHKEAVTLFSDYSRTGKNDALKTFAKETLPTLKFHLKHVRKLRPV